MKLFLLIFCLVCISITTAQRCTRKNETYTHNAKPLKTKTVEMCTAKCETSPNCVSWTWNKKKKNCYLVGEFDLAERSPWISGNCRGPEIEAFGYPDVTIHNKCNINAKSGRVSYGDNVFFCHDDKFYNVAAGGTWSHSRGLCLIYTIYAILEDGRRCTYSAEGTSYSQFEIRCNPDKSCDVVRI